MATKGEPAFVDTGYLVALDLASDQYHQTALTHWISIRSHLPQLVTTSYVFSEVVTFFNSRGHHAKAVQIGNILLHSAHIDLIHVDEWLFEASWDYMRSHQDKTYSLADCISFLIMQQRRIALALAFDQHFVQAGFRIAP